MPDPPSQPSAASDPLLASAEAARLRDLFAAPTRTLADYHSAGRLLARLAARPQLAARGSGWKRRLGKFVGQSESTLTKCLQLAREMPAAADVKALDRLGVGWGAVSTALAVPDPQERLDLLRRAKAEGWDDRQVQLRVRALRGSPVRGGGRPRKVVGSAGLAADLAEVLSATRGWLHLYDGAVRERLAADGYGAEVAEAPPALRAEVEAAVEELGRLARAARELRAHLARAIGP